MKSPRMHYLVLNEGMGHRLACGADLQDGLRTSEFVRVDCEKCLAEIVEHDFIHRYGSGAEQEIAEATHFDRGGENACEFPSWMGPRRTGLVSEVTCEECRDWIVGEGVVDEESDPVNHPTYYNFGRFEVIDVIEDWELGFHLGNAVKYIARAGRKGDRLEDLKKARWYLEREIGRLERTEQR